MAFRMCTQLTRIGSTRGTWDLGTWSVSDWDNELLKCGHTSDWRNSRLFSDGSCKTAMFLTLQSHEVQY